MTLTSMKRLLFFNVPVPHVLMQDPQELMGYQDTMDQMDRLVPRAQKAKKEQMGKEEKWVFCQLFNYFLVACLCYRIWKGPKCVQWR